MKATVIGCGRWGSFIAWYLSRQGYQVTVYGRPDSERFHALCVNRGNELLSFDQTVSFSSDLRQAVASADQIFISISTQSMRDLAAGLSKCDTQGKPVILCMKGLEQHTGMRMSEITAAHVKGSVAVWVGPGHVQDFLAGRPNCMVLDSADRTLTAQLVDTLKSDLIRFYIGDDLLGNEVGSAAKNVIGIAGGMLDGLELPALKGALMTRGAREIGRLISAMGGKEITAYGLAHLGDYGVTLFSPYSHNRKYGECIVTGEHYKLLAEGVSTCKAIMVLSAQYGVELPICSAVYEVVFNGQDAREGIYNLLTRSYKTEF